MAKAPLKEVSETSSRDAIRAAVFSSANFSREKIKMFGMEVEIRQPSVKEVIDLADAEANRERLTNLIINHTYVPGTEEKVFEKADFDSVLNMPSGDWMLNFQNAFARLSGTDVEEAEKNLEGTDENNSFSSSLKS